ncbi:MAG TPA: Stk1 family PASTA domain-containing Ser/Thr kinase [Mycobacterium sp.]|nr:Stk1 family PASTA domain-containing Ser/Thr kinase [Mycobacterium sp.]
MTTSPRLVGNRYELGELIGYGGMAEVHRGRDVRLGREVAIKILRADLAHDPAFLMRFRREAQSAAGLNYPAIVAVYDTGEDPSLSANGADSVVPYIVMEYVEGRTLRDVLKAEGRLPVHRAMEITAEVCGALDFSHRNGIVHRDIKPANVMITPAGAVKVMDFGIARAMASNAATVTQTAAVIGTAQYLSPEQARGEPVDARSDVYSTGCLLYELVTGNPPFNGDSPVAVAYQHVRENAPLPSSVSTEIPRALDSIVMKALAKNPLNRYQSAAEMRADLQRAIADRPVEAETVMTDAERTQFIPRTPLPFSTGGGGLPPVIGAGDGGDDGDDDGQQRKRALIWTAVVAALLLVIGAGAYAVVFLGKSDKPKKVAVPTLAGLSVNAANDALRNAGFQPFSGTPEKVGGPCPGAPSNLAEGRVCTQDPAAGSEQTKDTPITFTTYKKPSVSVPDVKGTLFADASNTLHDKGLKAKRKPVNNSAPVGTVVDQNPAAFTAVPPGSTVTLSVSTGKSGVPSEKGKKVQDAKTDLFNQGWSNVSTTQQPTPDQNEDGVVIDQTPPAGSAFPKDTQITLVVGQYVPPTPTCTTATTPSTPPSSPSTPPSSPSTPPTGTGITLTPNFGAQAKPTNTATSASPAANAPSTPTCTS